MSGWQPRQRRAVETRRRLLDAAMAEMERVGVEAARIEDIVTAAGVSWGSFYRYFPSKDDVLLEPAATVAQVFADACDVGIESGRPAGEVIIGAFFRAASAAPHALPLWEATFRVLADRPERLTELLADRRIQPPSDALSQLIDIGQRRGELRDDYAAPVLAGVILNSVWANALREGPRGISVPPPPRSGEQANRRSLAVALLVDGMRRPDAPPAAPPPPGPGRIGRHRPGDGAGDPSTPPVPRPTARPGPAG